jgi:hypothetical protein
MFVGNQAMRREKHLQIVSRRLERGRDTLGFHIEGMIEDGEQLPTIRHRWELMQDPEFAEAAKDGVLAYIQVDLPGKPVRINISIDDSLLGRIDRAAKAAGETRSGFLAEAAKVRLKA